MQASTVAIVTGASRGLGQALALGLMQADTRLTTVARSHDPKLAEHAAATGCTLQQVQSDLANPSAAERVAKQVVAGLPAGAKRYVLINNAGTVHPIHQAADLDNAAAITAAFSLNVTSVMLITAAFLQAVKPLQADCRIINISSGAGRNPTAGWGVYCATKAALDHYSNVLHAENHGVRIVSLAPGVVDTGMQETIRGSTSIDFPNVERFAQLHAQGQLAAPADVAGRILRYLSSDDFGTTVLDDIRNHA
ncbi:SDR family oxidoreductase [Pollutimonas harenae]|uniref:SDR family oxidoreductase n=1 Tax=Pollutimonas harenae TaxID=657015 RepID=A0A853H1Q0_9BURK|nr:SDR family oxidoreductase [Pollutimonas harenae]NYT86222.1 SDR family oxidoreductase [Pollutimonas harenae]TEA71254.1 SDR family oxidoreductase [Pollutimonas harenae]